MAVPTVLLYNLENEKGRKIKLLCLTQKLRARAVSPAEYGETVGALAGFGERTGASYTGPGFSGEMLVMAGLSGRQLDAFLRGLRQKCGGTVALKAILTETNMEWDSVQLYQELQRERQAMEAQGREGKA